jgi:hypothetical protein
MSGMAALAAAAAATQKMATPTITQTPPTTPLPPQATVRLLTPQQLLQTQSGQTIKLATTASPGQQAIRLITPGGQTPIGTKQIFVQKAGQTGTGQPQLMTLVKTPQGLTLAPAGTKGIPAGQVVKLVATQTGQKAGTPTIIQASPQSQQLYQIATTGANVSGAQIATTASGQKVITTLLKTLPSGVLTMAKQGTITSANVSTVGSGIFNFDFRICLLFGNFLIYVYNL